MSVFEGIKTGLEPAIEYERHECVKQEPYVDDEGIWVPCMPYVPDGCVSDYKLVMSKEIFVEAYNKWIKGE